MRINVPTVTHQILCDGCSQVIQVPALRTHRIWLDKFHHVDVEFKADLCQDCKGRIANEVMWETQAASLHKSH